MPRRVPKDDSSTTTKSNSNSTITIKIKIIKWGFGVLGLCDLIFMLIINNK